MSKLNCEQVRYLFIGILPPLAPVESIRECRVSCRIFMIFRRWVYEIEFADIYYRRGDATHNKSNNLRNSFILTTSDSLFCVLPTLPTPRLQISHHGGECNELFLIIPMHGPMAIIVLTSLERSQGVVFVQRQLLASLTGFSDYFSHLKCRLYSRIHSFLRRFTHRQSMGSSSNMCGIATACGCSFIKEVFIVILQVQLYVGRPVARL